MAQKITQSNYSKRNGSECNARRRKNQNWPILHMPENHASRNTDGNFQHKKEPH